MSQPLTPFLKTSTAQSPPPSSVGGNYISKLKFSPHANKRKDPMVFSPECSHYTLSTLIGKGHFHSSSVYLTKHIPSKFLVAVQRVNLDLWEEDLTYLQNEIVLTQQLCHPNLLKFHTCFICGQELWIVMPFYAFGSCLDLIRGYFTDGLPEQAILLIVREVLQALDYIHRKGVIHRAVKASHVLISESGQVCLSGLHNCLRTYQNGQHCRKVHEFPAHSIDYLDCYSPELLEQNLVGYGCNSDIYSLGILTCELANGLSPFSDMPATQMLIQKINGKKPKLADSTTADYFLRLEKKSTDPIHASQEQVNRQFFQRTFSPHLHNFTSLCLERDAISRPSANQLLSHYVFADIKTTPSTQLPDLLEPVKPGEAKTAGSAHEKVGEFTKQLSQVYVYEDWIF